MDKRLDNRDIGMDCDYMVCAPTQDEAVRLAGEHVQRFHGMKGFSKGFYDRSRAAIREGSCAVPKDCPGSVCRL
jgi:predicted small metal-binding protein